MPPVEKDLLLLEDEVTQLDQRLERAERRIHRLNSNAFSDSFFKSATEIPLGFGAFSELTIASGIVTKTFIYHSIDTEANAASDNLAGVGGGVDGDPLIIRPDDDARTIVVKHNDTAEGTAGTRIFLNTDADVSLDDADDTLTLIYDSTADSGSGAWIEVSRGQPFAHALLSATHSDTLADTVVDGDVVIGNVTPAWSRLAISIPAANVRNILGIDNAELRPSWKTALDATAPADIAAAASAGTSLVFPHRDHVHAHPDLGDLHTIYLLATGARAGSTGSQQSFGATGIKADVIAESTAATGVTIDGALLKDDSLFLTEKAAAGADTAGEGQFWVKSDVPNTPQFTDDAGNDLALIWSGGAFHDGFSDFVADEHVAHAGVTLTAGVGLSGGGDISASRTFTVDLNELTTEVAIAAGDFLAMVDITDSGSGKVTFANLEATISHDNIAGVSTSDHHVKYTDAEAIAAVEGEATLDLTGDVTIAAAKSLAVDTIAEKTAAAGVTIDGVLLKDSLIAAGAVPDTHGVTPSAHHVAVTLDANADTLLSLSTQALGLDTQTANLVFAGPAAGIPAVPTFRALVSADLPATAVETTDADWIDLTDGGATTLHTHAGVGAHDLLDGSTHGDTLADVVTDGDIVIGNVTPKWSSLAISVPAANVRNVLGVDNAELRPSWKAALDATAPSTSAVGDAAAAGTSLVFSHRDHVHGREAFATNTITLGTAAAAGAAATLVRSDAGIAAFDATAPTTIAPSDAPTVGVINFAARRDHLHGAPATFPATAHDLLAATHGDTLADAVTDGDIIIGNVTPKWSSLAISVPAANVRNVLGIDNAELRPSWKTALDATAPANIAAAASAGTSLVFSHRDHVHAHPDLGDLHTIYLLASGARAGSTGSQQDFGATGLKLDIINESTVAAGVAIDGFLIKDSALEGIGGFVDVSVALRVASTLGVDTINEFNAGTGVTIDGLLIKDEYIEADETADPGAPAANKLRVYALDSGGVTGLQLTDSAGTDTFIGARTRYLPMSVLSVPAANENIVRWSDGVTELVRWATPVPTDWVTGTDITVNVRVITPATGTAVLRSFLKSLAEGEADTDNIDNNAVADTAFTANQYKTVTRTITGASIAAGDHLSWVLRRLGGDAGDTLNNTLNTAFTAYISYTAFF